MTALIIDGISASGKSYLLRALKKHADEERPNFTKVHLTEHLTERFFEGKSLVSTDIENHVVDILNIVERLQRIKRDSPFANNAKVITITIERLFLTLMSRDLMNDEFFARHGDLIKQIDIRSLLLVIPDQLIKARLERSLIERNEGWRSYIAGLGGLSKAVDHFSAQQQRMKRAHSVIDAHLQATIVEVQDVSDLSNSKFLRGLLCTTT